MITDSIANVANDDSGLEFNTSITGDASEDTDYVTAGVIDQDNGSYNFKENVTINSEVGALFQPSSSYTTYNRFVAPVYTAVGKDITINMNNNILNINRIAGNEMNASKLVGLAAGQGSSLEINNAGNINVTFANARGNNHTGALAYGGGKLIIHNGGENQDQKIFSFNGLYEAKGKRGLYAETKKSDGGKESQIIIDGLVNIIAEDTSAYGGATVSESYAVQADSAQIDIGGGKFVGRLEAKHTYNYGDVTRINVNTQKDNDGNVIGAGDNVVQIDGDLRAKGSSSKKAAQVNVGLNGEDSYLRGNVIGTQSSNATLDNESAYDSTTKYGINIYMDNGADWTGDAKGALTLRMHNGATWHGGSNAKTDSDAINHMSMTLDTGAVWYHTGTHDIAVDYFTGGKDEAARGTIVMDGDKNITLSNYTGNTMVSFVRDSEYPTRVLGGNITIGSAAEGSVITLSTDNDGLDTSNAEEVTKVMNKLAGKLTYTGAIEGAENNLDGYVQIAEGLTSSSAALKLGSIDFSAEDGKGSLQEGSIVTPDGQKNPGVIYGSSETAMMKGAKSAMASTAMIWRAESNDLMKRMGDLRLAKGERGLWAKYYGGKYEMDAQNTNFSTSYKAYQLGYDTKVGDWTLGAAVSYNDGNSTYSNGRGDEKAISLGLYGTWNKEDGQYLDLILKRSRLENEFKVYNDGGHKLDGDYKNWATSLSAEYGKRFEGSNGFYVDPSVEFTLGRVNSKNYNAQSDYLDSLGVNKNLEVQQDAFTTAVGRLGVRVGQKLDKASYFVKLAAAHEFSGDFDTTYHAIGEPEGKTSIDFGDTWYEAQIGGTAKLGDNSLLYASFERSFGGDVEEKWRVDAGLRWSF